MADGDGCLLESICEHQEGESDIATAKAEFEKDHALAKRTHQAELAANKAAADDAAACFNEEIFAASADSKEVALDRLVTELSSGEWLSWLPTNSMTQLQQNLARTVLTGFLQTQRQQDVSPIPPNIPTAVVGAWSHQDGHIPDTPSVPAGVPSVLDQYFGVVSGRPSQSLTVTPQPGVRDHSRNAGSGAMLDVMLCLISGELNVSHGRIGRQYLLWTIVLLALVCLLVDIARQSQVFVAVLLLGPVLELICCIVAVFSLRANKIWLLMGSRMALMEVIAGDLVSSWKQESSRALRVPLLLWAMDVAAQIACNVWGQKLRAELTTYPWLSLVSRQISGALFTAIIICQIHASSHLTLIVQRFCVSNVIRFDAAEGVEAWNVLQALSTHACATIEFSILATRAAAFARMLLLGCLVMFEAPPFRVDFWGMIQVLSVLARVLAVFYSAGKAAHFTSECSHAVRFINSLCIHNKLDEEGRLQLVSFMKTSAAGFYFMETRIALVDVVLAGCASFVCFVFILSHFGLSISDSL